VKPIWFVLLVVGCNESAVGPQPDLCEAAQALRSSPEFLTVAEEADIAARVLPGGFGGLHQELGVNSDGVLVAHFKENDTTDNLKANLRTLLLCNGAYPGWSGRMIVSDLSSIVIRQGQYTATELLMFLRALESLRSDPVVWAIEIDPELNRVWVGLRNASDLSRIEQLVTQRGVPPASVSIEVPPPIRGDEQFQVINGDVQTRPFPGEFGALWFPLAVRFTNLQESPRYAQWCVEGEAQSAIRYFEYVLERWDGSQWKIAKYTVCATVLMPPRSILPGESATDSIPIVGARRLNTVPPWLTARITGTYRFVGMVYESLTATPPFVADPAQAEEQVSVPFRLVNTLPF